MQGFAGLGLLSFRPFLFFPVDPQARALLVSVNGVVETSETLPPLMLRLRRDLVGVDFGGGVLSELLRLERRDTDDSLSEPENAASAFVFAARAGRRLVGVKRLVSITAEVFGDEELLN